MYAEIITKANEVFKDAKFTKLRKTNKTTPALSVYANNRFELLISYVSNSAYAIIGGQTFILQ